MRFIRKNSNCGDCPLRDQRRVPGEGPQDAKIIFIGEAPGKNEAAHGIDEGLEFGKPFVGKAGRRFNWGLGNANILRHRCWITNILLCKLPNNDFNSPEAQEALKCCFPGFRDEMRMLSPRVVVPLGYNPSRLLGIDGNISSNRGHIFTHKYIFEHNNYIFIPTFHPSYIERGQYSKKRNYERIQVHHKYLWIADLKKVKEFSRNEYTKSKQNYCLSPGLRDHSIPTQNSISFIGVDCEATGLNTMEAEIVVVGLAFDKETALSCPTYSQGRNLYKDIAFQTAQRKFVQSIFNTQKLAFQNALYDVRLLQHNGYHIPEENIIHDSLLLFHCINPELKADLESIVSVYGHRPKWKSLVENREDSIFDIGDVILRTYNLEDASVLHEIIPPMLQDLKEIGTEDTYYKESIPLIFPIIQMMDNGVLLDKKKLDSWSAKTKRRLSKIEKELKLKGNLPESFNLNSGDDLRYFLYNVKPNKFEDLDSKIESKKRKDTKIYKNLIDLRETRDNTKMLYLPPHYIPKKTKKTSKISTDEEALLSLRIATQNRYNEILSFKRSTPKHEKEKQNALLLLEWLTLCNDYIKLEKLYSTYRDFPIDTNSRVHSDFLIHGTATGRLSSNKPNLQNIPKKELGIRKCFVPKEGYIFLSGDYINLEVWILAYLSKDEVLINALEGGKNIHDENTKAIFGINKSDKMWTLARRAAKIFQFGHIQYGGTERGIYKQVVLEVPELNLTFAQFEKASQNYKAAHPAYTEWRTKLEEQIKKTRIVSNPFGRKRFLMGSDYDIIKEGINFPIQSSAAHIINMSMIKIHKHIKQQNMKSKLILQIHDQLLWEVPLDEIEKAEHEFKHIMEEKFTINNKKVSLPVKMEQGPSWGELK